MRTTEPTLDPDCEHCSGADCDILGSDGETVTRTAVQWLHFMPFRTWLEEPRDFELEVVAFARWAAFFETEAAFDEGQRVVWGRKPDEPERATPDGPALRLSPIAFLPGGMFAPDGLPMTERATAILAGRVTRVTRLVNAATGAPFYRLRIDTFPGPIDTVLDPAASESEPQPGTIALVRAWLVGRPATPPPSPPTA